VLLIVQTKALHYWIHLQILFLINICPEFYRIDLSERSSIWHAISDVSGIVHVSINMYDEEVIKITKCYHRGYHLNELKSAWFRAIERAIAHRCRMSAEGVASSRGRLVFARARRRRPFCVCEWVTFSFAQPRCLLERQYLSWDDTVCQSRLRENAVSD